MLQDSLSLKHQGKCLNEALEAAMQGNVLPAVRRCHIVCWTVDRSTRCSDLGTHAGLQAHSFRFAVLIDKILYEYRRFLRTLDTYDPCGHHTFQTGL